MGGNQGVPGSNPGGLAEPFFLKKESLGKEIAMPCIAFHKKRGGLLKNPPPANVALWVRLKI